jgi:hypothetical protein
VIEEAIRAAGGRVTRNEALFGRLRFDVVARWGEELRLVADVRRAATTAELTRLLDDFSIAVHALRSRHPFARGLLVATGAVDRAALALLHNVAAVDTLAGEGPGWEAALRSAVTAAFEANSVPATPEDETAMAQEEAAREALREARVTYETAAAATRSRLETIKFGSDERGAATAALARGSAPAVPISVYGPDAVVLDSFSEGMRAQTPTVLSVLLAPNNFLFLVALVLSVGVLIPVLLGSDLVWRIFGSDPGSGQRIAGLIFVLAFMIFVTGFTLTRRYQVEHRAFLRYQRWGRQKLEEMLVAGKPGDELMRTKNRLIDAAEASGGFNRAFKYRNDAWPRDD